MSITLILGNQLFPDWTETSPLKLGPKDQVLMIEDLGIASHFRYHKLRLLHTFVAMRSFRDHLKKQKARIRYFELDESKNHSFFDRILSEIDQDRELRIAEIPDRGFRSRLNQFCAKNRIRLIELTSPQFLCSGEEFKSYLSKSKRPFMKTFYERERKRLKVLVEKDGSPIGERWSFDEENRKKLPKSYREPGLPFIKEHPYEKEVNQLITRHFKDHPGQAGSLYLPSDRESAVNWLQEFFENRFKEFGPYEDSISTQDEFLNHSLLAPLINLGLLNPKEVVDAALAFAKKHKVPLASLEGFIRQIIGWREFIKGVDSVYGEQEHTSNFFGHERGLKASWYEGNTGIPPLDDAIKKVNRRAYLHHIERLMIVSNLMLLCEIHPKEAYRWFMEMFLDSYEWVMGPNVFGMAQMSDGGIFATKPYISGSNYILKMSHYQKGPWCEIWDGLYWRFIEKHRSFFGKNPRLSMMVKLLDRMPEEKKARLFKAAEAFINEVSHPVC